MQYKIKDYHNEIFRTLGVMTKFSIMTIELDDKAPINVKLIRNFIAKSYSLLTSIHILISNHQKNEAFALYRLLIERYLYLEHLQRTNSYQAFSDWSYCKAFDSRNSMRGAPEFNSKEATKALMNRREDVLHYQELKKKPNLWREPKMQDVAKDLGLEVLYKFGYDSGSGYIHPRAEEGIFDALRIVKGTVSEDWLLDALMNNSLLIANSLFSVGLVYAQLPWVNYFDEYLYQLNANISDSSKPLGKFRFMENIIMAKIFDYYKVKF